MAATIRIKRSTGSSAPTTLKQAELAYAEAHNTNGTLFIGVGVSGENASSILAIAGPGSYLGLSSGLTQTAAGSYTFSGTATFSGTTSLGAATASTPSANDDSTRVATTEWVTDRIASFGAGTVTSVALSLPNIFSVSGSPVTTTGTLSASLASQTANYVFAAPNGSNGSPTFRALTASDIPSLSATYLPLTGGSLSGNLVVGGDLTVNGTVTTINSTTISVDDKAIELGSVYSPSDSTADGGGIVLKGATDKTLLWVNATDSWTANQNFDLASTFAYKIAGTNVLSASTLGSGVTASSLTSVGTLTSGALGTGFTTVAVPQGGTGVATLTGIVKGNGTSAFSAAVAGTDYLAPDSTIDGGVF